MHSVQRSSEPNILSRIRRDYAEYDELSAYDRVQIRDALRQDFSGICGYCERECGMPTGTGSFHSEETIDHFRPRRTFPDMDLDWLNLIYACNRCNQAKGGRWPEPNDLTSKVLPVRYGQLVDVSEYVSPNSMEGRRSAQDYFDFDRDTGEIVPHRQSKPVGYSMAARTIWDFDLNEERSVVGGYDPRHLCNLRRNYLNLLTKRLSAVNEIDVKLHVISVFSSPGKPFSSFVNSYFRRAFPQFDQISSR